MANQLLDSCKIAVVLLPLEHQRFVYFLFLQHNLRLTYFPTSYINRRGVWYRWWHRYRANILSFTNLQCSPSDSSLGILWMQLLSIHQHNTILRYSSVLICVGELAKFAKPINAPCRSTAAA